MNRTFRIWVRLVPLAIALSLLAVAVEAADGEVLGLDILLPEATARVDGFSDACHSLTAATTVAIGREEQLIDEMENILISD